MTRFLLFLALGVMPAEAATNIERFRCYDFVFPPSCGG